MKINKRSVGIPEPTNQVDSLWRTTQALKEAVEVLQGTRGNRRAVYVDELEEASNSLTQQITDVEVGVPSPGLYNVVEDLTPQLGGDLDLNGSDITGTGNVTITGYEVLTGDLSLALTGTVSVTASTATVTGVGTLFFSEAGPGTAISIGGEVFTVIDVASNTSLTLDSNHVAGAAGVTAYTDNPMLVLNTGNNEMALQVTDTGLWFHSEQGNGAMYLDSVDWDKSSYFGIANDGTGGGSYNYLEFKVVGANVASQPYYAGGSVIGFVPSVGDLFIGNYVADQRWLKFELDTNKYVNVEDGSRLRIWDDTEADVATHYHDGTDYRIDLDNNTQRLRIGSSQFPVVLVDGTDYAEIGTDVNTATDNYSTLTAYYSADNAQMVQLGRSGSTASYEPGKAYLFTNTPELVYDSALHSFKKEGANAPVVRIYDADNNSYLQSYYVGADFLHTFVNTVDWEITGLSGNVVINDQDIGVSWDIEATDTELLAVSTDTFGETPVPDPNLGDVVFLASFENTAAGLEVFTPEIGQAFEWIHTAGTQPTEVDGEVSTAQAKFGTRSLYMKETAGLPTAGWQTTTEMTNQLAFSGDFTIEMHVYIVAFSGNDHTLIGMWDFPNRQWLLYMDSAGRLTLLISTTGSNNPAIFAQAYLNSSLDTIQTGQWYHISVCRSGTNWYMHVDGNGVYKSGLPSGDYNPVSDSSVIYDAGTNVQKMIIGQQAPDSGQGTTECYIDNIRITDGTARYATTSFTAPTGPFEGGYFPHEFVVGDPSIPTRLDGQHVYTANDFYILDSTEQDAAQFSHNGTNFITTFTNTVDWDLVGIEQLTISGGTAQAQGVSVETDGAAEASYVGCWQGETSQYIEIAAFGSTQGTGGKNTALYWSADASPFEIQGDFGAGAEAYMLFINEGPDTTKVAKVADGTHLRIEDGGETDQADIYHDGTDLRVAGGSNTRLLYYDFSSTGYGGSYVRNVTQEGYAVVSVESSTDGPDFRYAEFGSSGSAGVGSGHVDMSYLYYSSSSSTPDYPYFYFFNDYGDLLRFYDNLTFNAVDVISDSGNNPTKLRIFDPSGSDHVDFYNDGTNLQTDFTGVAEWNINGDINLGGNLFTDPEIKDFGVTHHTATITANAVTFDASLGNSIQTDLEDATGAVTVTLSNPPPSGTYGEIHIISIQGATPRDYTWPGSVTWINGLPPLPTQTENGIDVIHLFTVDGGTNWYGTYALKDGFTLSFAGLSDTDLTGAANNDMLFRSGGSWIDTAGALTWDGSVLDLHDNQIQQAEVLDFSVTSSSATPTGTTQTLAYATAQSWEVDLGSTTGDITITLSGGPPSGTYGEMVVKVVQHASTARIITWAGGTFKWPDGTIVPLSTTLSAVGIYHFSTWDTGTTWWATSVQDMG